jgi:hypothetical protein
MHVFVFSLIVCVASIAAGLLDQPAAAQADGVAGLARGSAVQVAAAALVVVRNVRHVQLSRGAHKILAVVGLVGAHGDAA